jgi:hypothetical protein
VLFAALLLADIDVSSNPSVDAPRCVAQWYHPGQEWTVLPVPSEQGQLYLQCCSGLEGLRPAAARIRKRSGSEKCLPVMGVAISGWHARIVVPMAVDPEYPPVGLRHPDQLRDGVGQRVKLPLACPECCFGALAFGNLLGCDIDTHNLAIRTPDRVPVGDPRAVLDLISALPGHLDPGHRFASRHDGADDRFDRFG